MSTRVTDEDVAAVLALLRAAPTEARADRYETWRRQRQATNRRRVDTSTPR